VTANEHSLRKRGKFLQLLFCCNKVGLWSRRT
jgi:hypothetical protein